MRKYLLPVLLLILSVICFAGAVFWSRKSDYAGNIIRCLDCVSRQRTQKIIYINKWKVNTESIPSAQSV